MGWWLATKADAHAQDWLTRFDPRFWTVNFPRPMMAAVTTTAADALRVDAVFYRKDDLAGLIWAAEDATSHPLTAYETSRDFRGCRLRFRWRSGGLMPLDAVNGPTLTIEGRDAAGSPRAWYVRLWNYAVGTPEDALVTLDFADLAGGFLLPGEADPVWAGDIDRLFVSLVPPGYDRSDAPLAEPAEGWVELSGIACEGSGAVLAIGDTMVPPHKVRIATGFDDSYNVTPARMLREIRHLGYAKLINHYVGMSHYFRLDGGVVTLAGGALNVAAAAWHADFLRRAEALGYAVILSLSYELFDAHCPGPWKQRAADGTPALTGWAPPSTLLSPANGQAMAYLQAVARAFVALTVAPVRFQIGEPWWWVRSDGTICLYDDAARAALGNPSIINVRNALSATEKAVLDQAGALLAASTAALRDAVRAEAPGAEVLLLVYLPTVLDAAAPEARRANVPLGWANPAYDMLQLEDYDFVKAGDTGSSARAAAAMDARLGYPPAKQHYLSGFVLNGADKAQWREIDAAAERAVAETFFWALPQIARDGFVHFDEEKEDVQSFHDVRFPLALGLHASGGPEFSTAIVVTASGAEQRNSDWADARMRFDAGLGVRSEADLQTLVAFFRARRGAACGFRFQDPFDNDAEDQPIGVGDGVTTRFPLVKDYDGQRRRITRPVAESVGVSVGGWSLEEGGIVSFAAAPAAGVTITASFRFDVPVRFAEDRLEISLAGFRAGEVPSVPLVEIREHD